MFRHIKEQPADPGQALPAWRPGYGLSVLAAPRVGADRGWQLAAAGPNLGTGCIFVLPETYLGALTDAAVYRPD
jgi:hypothetical protein